MLVDSKHTLTEADSQALRVALGAFSSGVAIVTTIDSHGLPVGVTTNSVSSISLEPPLISWSLAKDSQDYQAYIDSSHFAVHVLSQDQLHLSNRFSLTGGDKFAGVNSRPGHKGIPLIEGSSARLQCELQQRFYGSEYVIFIGRIIDFDQVKLPSLMFHDGKFAVAPSKVDALSSSLDTARLSDPSFGEDFLGYLLLRSYAQFQSPIRQHVQDVDLNEVEFLILVALFHRGSQSSEYVQQTISDAGYAITDLLYSALIERGFIQRQANGSNDILSLSPEGRRITKSILSSAKDIEESMVESVGLGDAMA